MRKIFVWSIINTRKDKFCSRLSSNTILKLLTIFFSHKIQNNESYKGSLSMWFEDLADCDYFANILPVSRIAIGWLEKGKQYTTGEPLREIVEKIHKFNKTDGMYVRFLGFHKCDFCDFVNIELGATTIMIAYENKVYICPALITHYIENHNYSPPSEFIEAVLNYDHQYAMDYFKEVIQNKSPKSK